MPKCEFTDKYDDREIRKLVNFNCQEMPLVSGLCIFHDKDYLQDKSNNEEHKRNVLDKLKYKLNHAISNNESLVCIGFHLPGFSLSDLTIYKEFLISINFSGSQFFGEAEFSGAIFDGEANFSNVNFQGKANFFGANFQGRVDFGANFQVDVDFSNSEFYGKTYFSGSFNDKTKFNYVLFEGKEKIYFDIENLSNVSFVNTRYNMTKI